MDSGRTLRRGFKRFRGGDRRGGDVCSVVGGGREGGGGVAGVKSVVNGSGGHSWFI